MNHFLYLIGTGLFLCAMCKQLYIVIISPAGDPLITTKVLFFFFNLCVVSNMWLLYNGSAAIGVIFFLIAAVIVFWTYFINKVRIEP